MAEIDLKTLTPDTTLPTTGFLFGADSQAAASPSVYSTQAVATTLLGSTTLTGAPITADAPVLNMSQTWNASGVTFTGLKFNATNTSSASGSFLINLQIGGISNFAVRRYTSGPYITLNNNGAWIGGKSVSGTNLMVLSGNPSGADSAALSTDNFYVGSSIGIGFCAGSIASNNIVDTILTRRAAANLRLGAADAAAPVAQTLSVQSVVAGTTNKAGEPLTITGSQGTGTGAGGSIIFQVAPAGSSGTAQNALVDALTINADRSVTIAAGASGSLILSDVRNTRIFRTGDSTSSILFETHTSKVPVVIGGDDSLSLANAAFLGWGGVTSQDVRLFRDAANTLALRNGTNAQEQRVYGSYTSATNFQRMSIKTLRESSGALSGASYTTTIAIPAYANLIGVTTRVTTAITGATTYDVGDGTDVDLWGAAIGIALGSQSQTSDFTAVGAVGAAAASRTVTLTANGSNFTGGVVEICLHYLTTEAD